jgi:hypothetical protein
MISAIILLKNTKSLRSIVSLGSSEPLNELKYWHELKMSKYCFLNLITLLHEERKFQ